VAHWQGQSTSAVNDGNAEILAQIEQNKRQAFLKRAAYQVRASQMHPVPTADKTSGHVLKGDGFDPKADLDEAVHLDSPDLATGNCFAAEVIGDAGDGCWKRGNQSGRQDDRRRAPALAPGAGDTRNSGEQDVSGIWGSLVRENSAPLFIASHRKCGGEFLQLPSR